MFGDTIYKEQDAIVEQLCQLIRIPSKAGGAGPGMPYGSGPAAALQSMLDLASQMGFRTVNHDGHYGYAEWGKGDGLAAVIAHLDVVPEGNNWTVPPFGGIVKDGAIYGRGAADDKGPAVVALYGLKALKDAGITPQRRMRVIFGVCEETGMEDMMMYARSEQIPDMAFSPDGGYPIINGEKGIMRISFHQDQALPDWLVSLTGGQAANMVPDRCYVTVKLAVITADQLEALNTWQSADPAVSVVREDRDGLLALTIHGKSAHGGNPADGINAITHALAMLGQSDLTVRDVPLLDMINSRIGLDSTGAQAGIAVSDEQSGPLSINLGLIACGAAQGKATVDVRYPVTTESAPVLSRLGSLAADFGLSMTVDSDSPPSYVPPDSQIIQLLQRTYQEATGEEAKLITISGGSYARMFRGRCVLFGGAGSGAHQPDEHVSIEELMKHARICTQAMYDMATAPAAVSP